MPHAPDLAGLALDDRYELRDLLGEGAFGRVYRGFDLRLGRAVAVKVIKPWWADDTEWVERFHREAELLARVNDAGVVAIFDIGYADEGPYYVAELVEGESLSDRLRDGKLKVDEARSIAEKLCGALAAAHDQGVVHCDVKPSNVLLGADGRVKVGDFGIARLADGTSAALSATIAGTPLYMSPEQARGRPTTAATDVYSTGVVLYEMLSGRPPFADGPPVELGLRHLQDQPPPLPRNVPKRLRDVVERALAKDPADRFENGRAMEQALRATRGPGVQATVAAKSTTAGSSAAASPTVKLAAKRRRDGGTAITRLLPHPPGAPRAGRPTSAGARRRRLLPAVAVGLLLVGSLIAALVLGDAGARTTVPELRKLPRGGVEARARRLHVVPAFSSRHSDATAGTAIAQTPAPGARVAQGSTVQVVLSAGPPPVALSNVVGRPAAAAESLLADAGLRYHLHPVAAPGSTPGVVVRQAPDGPTTVPRGSTVGLWVSQPPQWHPLTTFSGVDDGRSVPFRILGHRWRVTYSMAFEGTCVLLVVCDGPSAEAIEPHGGVASGNFELNEGTHSEHVFDEGPGLFQLMVSGGRDSARWRMTVEDYY